MGRSYAARCKSLRRFVLALVSLAPDPGDLLGEPIRCPPDRLAGRGGGVVAMSLSTQVTISTEQVDLLSVTGRLDDLGLTQLRTQLEALFDTGTGYLVVDLAGVTCCDYRLFDVLTRTRQFLVDHQGWMRLVGIGP
ncbi:MAG: STAS domain-containing protein, partial [Actinobacteria bacterium]|nr:STAS domain-containing protein [Actinomycetota bacterium]